MPRSTSGGRSYNYLIFIVLLSLIPKTESMILIIEEKSFPIAAVAFSEAPGLRPGAPAGGLARAATPA